MRNIIAILLLTIVATAVRAAEVSPRGDTIPELMYGYVRVADVYVNGPKVKRIYRDRSRLERMVAKVYPIAKEANTTLRVMERELLKIKGKRHQKEYIKSVEKVIKKKYTPVLMRMTTTEGLILLKLIDRETGDTSYELVKELRGGFSAFFWQGIARLFSVNLKSQYDAKGEDRMIEYYIQKYEQERGIK